MNPIIPCFGVAISSGLEIAEGIWGDYLYNYVTEEFDE